MRQSPSKTRSTSTSLRRGAKSGFAVMMPIFAREPRRIERMDLGLKGRVAIVAAASKGLGRAVAEEFAKEGCNVAICARTAEELERTAAEIERASGIQIFQQALDVTSFESVSSFVDAV